MAIRPISEVNNPAGPYCVLGITANQSYANNANVTHTWTSEIYDPWGFHAPSGTSITVDRAGLWNVSIRAVLNVTPVGASTWSANVLKNALTALDGPGGNVLMSAVGFNYTITASGPMLLAANDVLTVLSSQNSGATGNFVPSSLFAVYYIGAA
jgi:hypothetical protein